MTSKQRLEFTTFDVFTKTPFKGNPLAIVKVPLDFPLSQSRKQAIAREFNFSETVFLHESEQDSPWKKRINIFTTTEELPFAGHPTIGTICSIATDPGTDSMGELTLLTKAGPIPSKFDYESSTATASIPHNVHVHEDRLERSHVEQLCPSPKNRPYDDLLDMWPTNDGRDRTFPVVSIVKGMSFILVDLPEGSGQLQKIQAGRQLIYANAVSLDKDWLPSFVAPYFYEVLSHEKDGSVRIRARMIEPSIGEDPATGSAASTLGAYLALQSGQPGNTYRFKIEQGVEMGRDSEIGVEVTLDQTGKAVNEVLLSGTAVQITEGTIVV